MSDGMRPSEEVIAEIRGVTDVVMLSFSTGKDAIAAYIAIRDVFPRIVPYYLYMVPGLEFVEESLAYYERVMRMHITRLPHPALHRWLNNFTFQPPERLRLIEDAGLDVHDYDDIHRALREDFRLPDEAFTASGVRAVDSPVRWAHFKKHGAINYKTRYFYPVYDWRKDRLIDAIRCSGIKLPIDYRVFGRSFDGLDFRFLAPIKEHFPRDYQRILDWFPLAELEMKRYEYSKAA